MRSGLLSAALGVCALALAASSALAQGEPAAEGPPQAPRLHYTRGPVECLDETDFRREVAIVGNSVDRFDATGASVVRVRFEKLPNGWYLGTAQLIDAAGKQRREKVETESNCEVLGRWVALTAHYYLPKLPEVESVPPKELADPVASKVPADPASAPAPADPVSNQTRAAAAPTRPAAKWPPPPPQRLAQRSPPSFYDDIRRLLKDMDLTIALSGVVLVTAGYTADAGPGFGIGVDVRGEQFSFGLDVRGVLPGKVYAREQLFPSRPSNPVEFEVGQLSALLVPCVHFAKYFAGCGVLQAGFAATSDVYGQLFLPSFGLGPRFAVEVPVAERFAVFGFGEALFAPGAPHHEYADVVEDPNSPAVRWEQSVVSGFFGAGFVVKFQ